MPRLPKTAAKPASKTSPKTSAKTPPKTPLKTSPEIARTIPMLRGAIERLRARKSTVALVPTMGALHDGHVSLVRLGEGGAGEGGGLSLFNPTQFAPRGQ